MYQLQSFAKNEKGRDFIVGDIHGMYNALMKLLESVNFDKNIDRLFSVGDLIDRGPKSLEVLYLNNQSWFFAVLGNHETMLLTGHLSYSKDWVTNLSKKQKEKCLDIIKTLPIAIEIETSLGLIGLVHAQVPTQFNDWNAFKHYLTAANLSYEMSSINDSGSVIRDALWGRKRIYRELKKNGTPLPEKLTLNLLKMAYGTERPYTESLQPEKHCLTSSMGYHSHSDTSSKNLNENYNLKVISTI